MFKKILDALGGNLLEGVAKITEKIKEPGQKAQVKLELERLVDQERMRAHELLSAELQAKERVLVAELTQGDNFTKRARPMVVYVGLGFIAWNYVLAPTVLALFPEVQLPPMELPAGFWAAWAGITGTWSIGRTMEKRGAQNAFTRVATGSPRLGLGD